MRLNYDGLAALQAVVREGSFERAARSLKISQSAVSQRLRGVEEQLGQSLVVRSSPPKPTKAGRALLNHAEQVLQWEKVVLKSLKLEVAESFASLTIGVNADSLATWFLDALLPTIQREGVLIELIVDDEHFTDELLRRGEVSGCVSAKEQPPFGCDSEALGKVRYYCVCTPAFRRKYFSRGFTKRAVEVAPTVLFSRKDSLHERFFREKFDLGEISYPFHIVPSSHAFYALIEEGMVYGLVPEPQCREALKRGRLVQLTPNKFMEFSLYYHFYRLQPPFAEVFQAKLISLAQQTLRIG